MQNYKNSIVNYNNVLIYRVYCVFNMIKEEKQETVADTKI